MSTEIKAARYHVAKLGLVWDDVELESVVNEAAELSAPSPEEVDACKRWLKLYAVPQRAYNNIANSQTLKSFVQKTPGYPRVTNGALI